MCRFGPAIQKGLFEFRVYSFLVSFKEYRVEGVGSRALWGLGSRVLGVVYSSLGSQL